MEMIRSGLAGIAAAIILISAGLHAIPAQAQVYEQITLHGVSVSCTAASGKRVPLIISEGAQKWLGGYAHVDPGKGPSLMLSPTYLDKLPRLAAFNLFYHECAHLALPMGVGLGNPKQESEADCYAVKAMRNHGLIRSWGEFDEAMAHLRRLPASTSGHLPGPERVKAAARCAKLPALKPYADDAFCRGLDHILIGGRSYLERFDFDNKRILGGMVGSRCWIDEGKALSCTREFKDKHAGLSHLQKMRQRLEACLPADFEHSRMSGSGYSVEMHQWKSGGTGLGIFLNALYNGEVSFGVSFPK